MEDFYPNTNSDTKNLNKISNSNNNENKNNIPSEIKNSIDFHKKDDKLLNDNKNILNVNFNNNDINIINNSNINKI